MIALAVGINPINDLQDGSDPVDMAKWAKPEFTKGEVDRAGEVLISDHGLLYPHNWDTALQTINNWRSSHSYPLQVLKMGLLQRVKKIDERAVVAQRLKRLSSIGVKLNRNANMALTQMQDIGGARGIVRSGNFLDRLVHTYEDIKHSKKYDYVMQPKTDGYRSVHFVCKYASNLPQNQVWVGLRIEIQLRSRVQHAWATAVETVDMFSKQQIKTGGGEVQWRRFFALMSSDIAIRENKPTVPGTPDSKDELTKELRELVNELRVISVLQAWYAAVRYVPGQARSGAKAFLLLLDTDTNTLRAVPFTDEERARASGEYLDAEKDIQRQPSRQAVLVSVESVQALKGAYPNYFADTGAFIVAVKRAVS